MEVVNTRSRLFGARIYTGEGDVGFLLVYVGGCFPFALFPQKLHAIPNKTRLRLPICFANAPPYGIVGEAGAADPTP